MLDCKAGYLLAGTCCGQSEPTLPPSQVAVTGGQGCQGSASGAADAQSVAQATATAFSDAVAKGGPRGGIWIHAIAYWYMLALIAAISLSNLDHSPASTGCNNQAQASSQAVQQKFASAAASANASVSAANGNAQAAAQVRHTCMSTLAWTFNLL